MDINWQYMYRKPCGSSKGPAEGIKGEKPREKKNTTLKKQQQQTEVPVPFASAQTYQSGNGSPERLLAPFDHKAAGSHNVNIAFSWGFLPMKLPWLTPLKLLPYAAIGRLR